MLSLGKELTFQEKWRNFETMNVHNLEETFNQVYNFVVQEGLVKLFDAKIDKDKICNLGDCLEGISPECTIDHLKSCIKYMLNLLGHRYPPPLQQHSEITNEQLVNSWYYITKNLSYHYLQNKENKDDFDTSLLITLLIKRLK